MENCSSANNINACSTKCNYDPDCAAFTYDKDKVCCIKYGVNDIEYNENVNGYFKTPNQYRVVKLGDRTGGLIKSFDDKNIEECSVSCNNTHKCAGFSYEKGTCELKKSDGLTENYYQNGKQFFENTEPKFDPTCEMQRGDTVYECSDYIYQKRENAQQQCANFGSQINEIEFIWDDTAQSGCGINRSDDIFRCSKYAYQKRDDAQRQCANFGSTITTKKFIPSE